MAGKGSSLFEECAIECVYLCEDIWLTICSFWGDSKMYTPGTIANLQRKPTKTLKDGVIPKVRILLKQVIL